jgi:hypothetical protein
MNVINVLTKSSLSVELFAACITCVSILSVVVKHVSSQLSVLDERFATNFAFMIFSSSVSSNMSIESFLSCKAIAAHWTTVWAFTGMNSSENLSN